MFQASLCRSGEAILACAIAQGDEPCAEQLVALTRLRAGEIARDEDGAVFAAADCDPCLTPELSRVDLAPEYPGEGECDDKMHSGSKRRESMSGHCLGFVAMILLFNPFREGTLCLHPTSVLPTADAAEPASTSRTAEPVRCRCCCWIS